LVYFSPLQQEKSGNPGAERDSWDRSRIEKWPLHYIWNKLSQLVATTIRIPVGEMNGYFGLSLNSYFSVNYILCNSIKFCYNPSLFVATISPVVAVPMYVGMYLDVTKLGLMVHNRLR
jgi:hypothetical protein